MKSCPRRLYRNFDPGLYHEVAQRVRNGKFLLDPNCPRLKEAIYGQLAIALHRYRVKLLALHFMSDHFHALYMIECPYKFAKFLAFLHAGITRAYNRLRNEGLTRRARENINLWHEMKWLPVSPDEETVRWRMGYILGQAVAAGLVDHPIEFPGASTIDAMLAGEPLSGATFDATTQYRDSRLKAGARADEFYQTRTQLAVTPPHCWADLAAGDLRQRYIEVADSVAKVPLCRVISGKRTVPVEPTRPDGVAGADDGQEPVELHGHGDEHSGLHEANAGAPGVAQKVRIPDRTTETGEVYEAGPPRPKAPYRHAEGKKRRLPLILSRSASVRKAYGEAYAQWVARYVEAKEAYRQALAVSPLGLRAIAIEIPPNFLLGSMPYPSAG